MNNNNWISCEMANLTRQEKVFVTYMVRKINRSAKKLFVEAIEKQLLKECYIYDDKDNRGVMTVIEGENYYSFQVAFERDVNNYNIIKVIHNMINNYISSKGTKDLYLNINAYNSIIVNYFKNYGFVQDYLGFEFSMVKTVQKIDELSSFRLDKDLQFKKFEDNHADEYLRLLEDSFRDQNLASNENNPLGKNTVLWLKSANEKNNFGALWGKDCLIGLYVLEDEYIGNIAVLSKYKGKGYGTMILNHCLKDIFINKEYNECYLYTYAINTKAQKLYLKSGFEVSAYYSENTYGNK